MQLPDSSTDEELKEPELTPVTDSDVDANVYLSDDQLVVALDFGTTFSGIAYAFANAEKPDVVSIMDWPGLETRKQPKVPTVICYDPEDRSSFTWGGQRHKSEAVQGVKLLLDPDQGRPIYLPESTAKSDLRQLGKPAVDVAADFIGAMYQHAMSKIESKVPKEYLDMCQKRFVLTVPAVWTDKAKAATMKAAKKAGIYPISLIKEPEAAAIYTLHHLQNRSLAVGDAFVICDAGGGTVDLISYEIAQLSPRLELKELVPGKGGMAGSLGLNRRFEEAVKVLVGEDQFFHLRKTKGYEHAKSEFDRDVKTAFRGDSEEDYYINFSMANLADDPNNSLVSNCWTMKGDDIKTIFDPLIVDIERLVADQVNLVTVKRMSEGHSKEDHIKAIFLVGGFGSSEYLKCRLEAEHPDIQIIQPHGAWAAIVKGAVLSQLPQEALIVSNQATRHYGVSANAIFDEEEDEERNKTWDPIEGVWRIRKMTWYINTGDDLVRSHPIRFPFCRTLPDGYSSSQLIFKTNLLQSEAKIAPIYPSSSATPTNCTLTADLTSVDPNTFKKKLGVEDKKEYWEVHYDICITVQPAVMRFSLEVQRKEMGSMEARYD